MDATLEHDPQKVETGFSQSRRLSNVPVRDKNAGGSC
jgi:hypothetical protein